MNIYDGASPANANLCLENLRDILIDAVFENQFQVVPAVRFGTVRRRDHVQFCAGVNYYSTVIGQVNEIVVAASIMNDTEQVAQALILGLIMCLAYECEDKIACKAGTTKETEDYTGQYRNGVFKEYADTYGLIVEYTGNDYGFQPVGIQENVRDILKKHHVQFQFHRAGYTYGDKRSSTSPEKCVCPNCGGINYYERKRQYVYCANCLNKAALQWYGKSWDAFLASHEDEFTIRRAKEITDNNDSAA